METEQIKEQIEQHIVVKQTYHINAFDMEDITKLVYGKSIEMLESPNDTTHEYTVTKGKLNNHDQKDLDEAIKNQHLECWRYDLILNDLCNKGYIDPGKYFLRMSW